MSSAVNCGISVGQYKPPSGAMPVAIAFAALTLSFLSLVLT